ncbi:MAG TPA: hypothetical protein VGU03_08695 [Frateuria sp.]|uniref:hypothetical protein n=1 Tax=Frateuria sp. TaxID=2211372 RepID=UPI002DE8343B|nr:hypothetical protein [Frateuria sp.]
MENNDVWRGSVFSRAAGPSWGRYVVILIISCLFAACTTTSYKPDALEGLGFSASGCAILRYNGSFSEISYLGQIGGGITPQNARGAFVVRGTRVALEKVESSWDFENGYRMRLYLRVPIKEKIPTFYLEETGRSAVSKENLDDFVNSKLQPCR